MLTVFKEMREACRDHLLIAPVFLDLVIQANREYLMGYNISLEIAKYIHLSVIQSTYNSLDFDSFLFYN